MGLFVIIMFILWTENIRSVRIYRIHYMFIFNAYKGRNNEMKKILSFCLAILLSIGVLVYVAADVNHGHGPGVIVEEEGEHH